MSNILKGLGEGLADDFMKMARDKGYNPRLAGTPEQERERTQQMLKQREIDRANQPKPTYSPEQIESMKQQLAQAKQNFDPNYEYSDDYGHWKTQSEKAQTINSLTKTLKDAGVELEESKEADYGDEYQDMVKRVGQKAKEGPRKVVYDPVTRKYKTVPVKQPAIKQGVDEADKHSFVGKIQRGHELKKKVDQTWKDAADAEKRGDTKGADRAFNKHVRYANLERPGTWTTVKEQGVAEGLGLYGPFTVTINTGERPKSRTKTKKFRREDDAILWAQDWLEDAPQYVFATAEVTDPDGNVVWTTDEQGVAEGRENYNGLNLLLQKDDEELFVKASAGGRELGHVLFVIDGDTLSPQDLEVDERYRGQGIAKTMYDYVKSKGYKIRRSGQQTDAGKGFWAKHRPEQNVWEQGVAEGTDDKEYRNWNEYEYELQQKAGKALEYLHEINPDMFKQYGDEFLMNLANKISVEFPTASIMQVAGGVVRQLKQNVDEGQIYMGGNKPAGMRWYKPRSVPNEDELARKESAIMKGLQVEGNDEEHQTGGSLGTPYPTTYEQETLPYRTKGQRRTQSIAFEDKDE